MVYCGRLESAGGKLQPVSDQGPACVYAEGRLHTRTWEGQDGQKHYRTEIIANRVLFLDRQAVAPLPGEGAEEAGASEPEEDFSFSDEG